MRRLFSYYRQFDELSPDEVSRELRERRDEERRRHPAQQPPLDLSGAAWHGPPHPETINAATFALRRAVNAYPDATPLRDAIAASHDVEPVARRRRPRRGRADPRGAARRSRRREVEIAWPGWGLLPELVDRGGRDARSRCAEISGDADHRPLPPRRPHRRGRRDRARRRATG